MTDDGQEIVFTTSEALSADDGNGAPDVYIWKNGHTALISTGSVGGGAEPRRSSTGPARTSTSAAASSSPRTTPTASQTFTTLASTAGSASPSRKLHRRSLPAAQSGVAVTLRRRQPTSAERGRQLPAGDRLDERAQLLAAEEARRGRKVGLGVRVSGAGKISLKGTSRDRQEAGPGLRRDSPRRAAGPGETAGLAHQEALRSFGRRAR